MNVYMGGFHRVLCVQIMKSDEDVRMISAEAPVLFAKACEFFILEMTLRAWHVAEEQKRKTLTRQDISTAVNRTEVWDFLADTVPGGEEGAQMPPAMGGQRPMGVQMDSYQPQYMAMPGGGAPPGGMFAGMQPMPMMYQGIPPHMFMQNPQQQQQQQDGDSGNGNTTATNGEGQEEGS